MLKAEVLLRENMEDFFKKGTMLSFPAEPMSWGLFPFSSPAFWHKSSTCWQHNLI